MSSKDPSKDPIKEAIEKMSKQTGLDHQQISRALSSLSNSVHENMAEPVKLEFITATCINRHIFSIAKGNMVQRIEIDGRKLCKTCEKMFRLEYEFKNIDEMGSFEDYVMSQIVLKELEDSED